MRPEGALTASPAGAPEASTASAGPEVTPRGPLTWPTHALLRALSALCRVYPPGVVYALADLLALVVYALTLWREPALNRRRRRGALRNMKIAFGEGTSPRRLRRLAWRYARHVSWLLVEELRLPALTRRRLRARVDHRCAATLQALAAEGRGLIVASGHFGNWEVLGNTSGLVGLPATSLSRPCPEPGLQRWLQEVRQATGQRVLSKYGGLWPLKKTLDRGGVVGLNVDENTRKGGLFVPFCGALAATNQTAALLARRARAPVAVLTCQRVGRERFRLHLWRVVRHDPVLPADADRARITREVLAGFEQALEAYPEQWLWSLRRWETRPADEGQGGLLPPRVGAPLRLRGR